MRLMISKDGNDLGPYGLKEARNLVRNGEVSLDDWAWVEGAPEWGRLRDVPGLLPIPPGEAPLTPPSKTMPAMAEEHDLWRGHPSQLLNLNIYAAWAFLLGVSLASTVYSWNALIVFGVFLLLAGLHGGFRYVQLRSVEYIVTSQRIRVISGLFSKTVEEIELFRVKDTSAHQSFFERIFGLGTMTILSSDERTPRLILHGIPKAFDLREQVRQNVMHLRQRFGVRELDVM